MFARLYDKSLNSSAGRHNARFHKARNTQLTPLGEILDERHAAIFALAVFGEFLDGPIHVFPHCSDDVVRETLSWL